MHVHCVGSIISRLAGFQRIQQTYEINTKSKKRQKLGIIINSMTDGYVGSCVLEDKSAGIKQMIPVYKHDGEDGAKFQSTQKRWLWKLPAVKNFIKGDDMFWYYVLDPWHSVSDAYYFTRTFPSSGPLQLFNSGEIIIYVDNALVPTTHIGNYLSPLLEKIPAPSYGFGKSLIDLNHIDLSQDQTSLQLNLKNPIFKTLKRE